MTATQSPRLVALATAWESPSRRWPLQITCSRREEDAEEGDGDGDDDVVVAFVVCVADDIGANWSPPEGIVDVVDGAE